MSTVELQANQQWNEINTGRQFLCLPKLLVLCFLPSFSLPYFFPKAYINSLCLSPPFSLSLSFLTNTVTVGGWGGVISSRPLLIRPYYPNEFGLGRSFLFNELCISCRIDFRCTFSALPLPSRSDSPSFPSPSSVLLSITQGFFFLLPLPPL